MIRQLKLFFDRSFASLTMAQFLAVVNDNVLKQIFLLMVVAEAMKDAGTGGYAGQSAATALFAVPYLLFSVWAGQMADRLSKRDLIMYCKAAEIGIMILAGYGIWVENFGIILISLLLMATQSSLFSPAKYGILPELLPSRELSAGNGVFQMSTYVAIMLGTAGAGFLLDFFRGTSQQYVIPLILIGIAVGGWIASVLVERTEPADPDREFQWNFLSHFTGNLGWIGRDRLLIVCVVGYALVWFVGTILLLNLNVYGMATLGLDYGATSMLVVVTGLGLATGCIIAGWWSGDGVEIGLVLPAGVGMGFCLIILTTPFTVYSVGAVLFVAGNFGGMFMIPLLTALQEFPDAELKGEVLATANMFTFGGMIVSSGLYALGVGYYGVPAPRFMGFLGWGVLGIVGLFLIVEPGFLRRSLRLMVLGIGRILYRQKFRGEIDWFKEETTGDKGRLYVANHISYLDWFFIGACFHRIPGFVILGNFHEIPVLGWFLQIMRTIPINPSRPKQLNRALDEIERRLEDGQRVVIFPEGSLTRNGQLLGVRRGLNRFLDREGIEVVPVYLDNLWGRWWSGSGNKILLKWPVKLFEPVYTWFGEPMSTPTDRESVLQALQDLEGRARSRRLREGPTPVVRFVKAFRGGFWKQFGRDEIGTGSLKRGSVLVSIVAQTLKLEDRLSESESRVGVILPTSIPGFMANLAVNLSGRSVVNFNTTLPKTELKSCVEQSGVETVITTPEVRERLEFEIPVESINFKQLNQQLDFTDWMLAGMVCLLPASSVVGLLGGLKDHSDEHAVVFTSGTTGEPKGVRVSGLNILSNLTGLKRVLGLDGTTRNVLVLPLFHVFGYAAGIWGPGLGFCQGLYYHDPRRTSEIVRIIDQYDGEMMVGIPSLYRLMLRGNDPEKLDSLRIALSGAEALPEDLQEQFQREVGISLLNGYGCSEMTPGISINVPDIEVWDGSIQKGVRKGSVGRALPGVSIRIVDPTTGETCSFEEPGEVQTRGPGKMLGYVGEDELNRNQWWETGDRGYLDEDGFLHIAGRYDRFTKIGGEMISHRNIEQRAGKLLNEFTGEEIDVAVGGLLEDGKEVLFLVTDAEISSEKVHQLIRERTDLPNSWIPRQNCIITDQTIPRRAMGGLNLKELEEIGRSHLDI